MRRLMEWGILLVVAVMAGCCCQTSEPDQTGHDILFVPDKLLSAQQLAERLGLTVKENSVSMVMLRNAANQVMVAPDAGGMVSVNGKFIRTEKGIVAVKGILFVPETLEAEIRPVLKPLPEPATPPAAHAWRVAIDPGHGGEDPGTISRSGLEEKTITLPVAEDLAQLLKQNGFDVVMTRQMDLFIDPDDRAAFVNRSAADLLVSLHADSYGSPLATGYAVYTCRGASTASRAAAQSVADSLSKAGFEGMGLRQANYRILVCSACPGILVELGYLSNSRDAELLADRAVQEQLARAIADGIAEHFKR
jgi:N-acetylmuramoyl-L-alanine amidase